MTMRTGSGRCAYIDRPTSDGRLIQDLAIRPIPIPVTMFKEADADAIYHDGVSIVGRVTRTESFATSKDVFASVEVTEDWAIERLEAEQHFMEIDLDDVSYEMVTEDGTTTMLIQHGRLCSIHLGTRPCWPGLEFRLNP